MPKGRSQWFILIVSGGQIIFGSDRAASCSPVQRKLRTVTASRRLHVAALPNPSGAASAICSPKRRQSQDQLVFKPECMLQRCQITEIITPVMVEHWFMLAQFWRVIRPLHSGLCQLQYTTWVEWS